MKLWTDEEDKYLEDNYLIRPYKDIGKKLNRSVRGVEGRAAKLKLKDKYQLEYAVYQGENYLLSGTASECAKALSVSNRDFNSYKSKTGQFDNGFHIVDLGRWEIES